MSTMLRRLTATAAATVTTAVALGLAAPSAHAAEVIPDPKNLVQVNNLPAQDGCTNDLIGTNLTAGYTTPTYSSHWLNWVVYDSTGVHVYSADLLADLTKLALEWPKWTVVVATNAQGATFTFVNCVV